MGNKKQSVQETREDLLEKLASASTEAQVRILSKKIDVLNKIENKK